MTTKVIHRYVVEARVNGEWQLPNWLNEETNDLEDAREVSKIIAKTYPTRILDRMTGKTEAY